MFHIMALRMTAPLIPQPPLDSFLLVSKSPAGVHTSCWNRTASTRLPLCPGSGWHASPPPGRVAAPRCESRPRQHLGLALKWLIIQQQPMKLRENCMLRQNWGLPWTFAFFCLFLNPEDNGKAI